MTAFDRFDPFERRISDSIEEIAAARVPDYLDDILRLTARSSQRPRWTFLERWLPVDTALSRPTFGRRVPLRPLIVLALLTALVAGAIAAYFGQQKRLPAPFGPADNGLIAYVANSDIYVRDVLTGEGRLLIGGDGNQIAPSFSPDGTRLAYVTSTGTGDHFVLANADGSNPRDVALIPPTGNAQAAWAPDSRRMALIYDVAGVPQLSIASADGSPTVVIDLGARIPLDFAWSAPAGDRLLVRTRTADVTEIITMRPDGTDLAAFDLPGASRWGPDYTLSGAVYAPDGSTIAYNGVDGVAVPGGEIMTQFRVHLINPDGSNDRSIPGPPDPIVQENQPLYSPDGRWILVHRWHLVGDVPEPQGWLAVMAADGSAPARDIGPRIAGGNETGLTKIWSPDGTRVLVRSANTQQVFSIDPVSGTFEELPWTTELPDWQRIALR